MERLTEHSRPVKLCEGCVKLCEALAFTALLRASRLNMNSVNLVKDVNHFPSPNPNNKKSTIKRRKKASQSFTGLHPSRYFPGPTGDIMRFEKLHNPSHKRHALGE